MREYRTTHSAGTLLALAAGLLGGLPVVLEDRPRQTVAKAPPKPKTLPKTREVKGWRRHVVGFAVPPRTRRVKGLRPLNATHPLMRWIAGRENEK